MSQTTSPDFLQSDSGTTCIPTDPPPVDVDKFVKNLAGLVARRPKKLAKGNGQVIPALELQNLLFSLRKVLNDEPMLIEINPPVKIVGDLHGQFTDLLRMFDHSGWPNTSRYIFLGDYVDRGPMGVETFALISALKIKFPSDVWMLRGNHECDFSNFVYGFYDEIMQKYGEKSNIWEMFQDTFSYLSVAGLIGQKIFCMHGGLSPDLKNFDQIRRIPKPQPVPSCGLTCDLLWADPEMGLRGWSENIRGISYTFGEDVVKKFCADMKISMIVRAHQVPDVVRHRGFKFFAGSKLLTIFSAPNFCQSTRNDGAVLNIDADFCCGIEILRPQEEIEISYDESNQPLWPSDNFF